MNALRIANSLRALGSRQVAGRIGTCHRSSSLPGSTSRKCERTNEASWRVVGWGWEIMAIFEGSAIERLFQPPAEPANPLQQPLRSSRHAMLLT